ncbi:MAG: peptidoglycan D,D-transpeptidase FtsI family protein [Ferrimicrobium sp.]
MAPKDLQRPKPQRPKTQRDSRRIHVMVAISIVVAVGLVVQLLRITVLAPSRYTTFAANESVVTSTLPGLRGSIYDRTGGVLAVSVLRDTIVADPLQVTNPVKEAAVLAPLLGLGVPTVTKDLGVPGGYSVIATLVKRSIGSKIETLAAKGVLNGLTVQPSQARMYPNGAMAEPVIGRVGPSDNGQFGLEYQYQSLLAGRNGSIRQNVAANGLALPNSVVAYHAPRTGTSLELTLDAPLQYYAERALSAQVQRSDALGGTAIVMDVKTGQILAMASVMAPPLPGVHTLTNGAQPVGVARAQPTESWINQAVGYTYEPGSVAKIATFTAALQDHLITPTSTELVPPFLNIDGSIFHDAEPHPAMVMTMRQILAQSSNLGTILIARRLGPERLTASFKRFGWTEPTGLAFPGTSNGFMPPPQSWSPTAIGSMPIGQDQAVTPLQVLDSYNAIANGGVMVTPKLVLNTISPSGQRTPFPSPAPHRIVPKTVDSQMLQLLSGVTGANATAPSAAIPGYVVAGKTGTSQKPLHSTHGYQLGAYWGTFVGIVPAGHPVLSALVMLDQPVPIYGGSVAAPVFSQIMRYALVRYGITPSGQVTSGLLPAVASHSSSKGRR